MDIIENIKRRVKRFLGIEKLPDNPKGDRFTFVNDYDEINRQRIEEYKTWYKGDSDELLNFFTNEDTYNLAKDPIYGRNKKSYFWSIASEEASIKRVHSGIPRAIVETLTNAIGVPTVTINGKDASNLLDEMNFTEKVNQEQLPLTLVEGWGAYKISVDSKKPRVMFYQAQDVNFVCDEGEIVAIIFKDYYRHNKKDYLLLETRSLNEEGNACIEYELYKLEANDQATEAPLTDIPQLANLENKELKGCDRLLAVPCRFFKDIDNPDYGRSIFAGKTDLFDDLDQSLSQRSQTCRVSTPVEYYPADLLQFDRNGNAKLPKAYDRHFMQKPGGTPDGDGIRDGDIQTTQPNLNFDQYTSEQMAILSQILIGVLSPSTLGIDVAKRDNADAQREKEKVTTMMRNNVISAQTKISKELIQAYIDALEYSKTGTFPADEADISIKFPQFANPTFETQAQILTPMWTAGAMSTQMFVDRLYGDSLSEDEKLKEIEWLDNNRKMDALSVLQGLEDESVGDSEEEA